MAKTNVLYVTTVSLEYSNNGGAISGLTNILRLSKDSKIRLFIATIGTEGQRERVSKNLSKFDAIHFHLIVKTNNNLFSSKLNKLTQFFLTFNFGLFFPFPYESSALGQDHISIQIKELIHKHSIRVVIVEYLFSTLFFKDFCHISQKKIYVALNKEAEMYRLSSLSSEKRSKNQIRDFLSYLRLLDFEKKVHNSSDKCVFLGEADIPKYLIKGTNADVITPYLDLKVPAWQYTASNRIFFVGNIWHYPNFLAVKWLAVQLAPELLKLNEKIEIVIAGTSSSDVSMDWQLPNVKFIGFVPQEQIEDLFKTSDLFLCPIENDHGVKFKLVECISYGTPFIATSNSLKGVPYLKDMVSLDLNNPKLTANNIFELLSDRNSLDSLNKKIKEDFLKFVETQKNIWSRIILE